MPSAARKTTILLVDDDPGLRFLLQMELESWGFKVLDYGSAEDALKAPLDNFDLAVLDYNLPGHSGLELLHHLRAIRSQVPALLITSEKEIIHDPRWPLNDYTALLAKPFQRDAFHASISNCLNCEPDQASLSAANTSIQNS